VSIALIDSVSLTSEKEELVLIPPIPGCVVLVKFVEAVNFNKLLLESNSVQLGAEAGQVSC